MKRFLAGAIVTLCMAAVPCAAMADQILTYTGVDFKYVTPPYTTSDSVTGTLDLATPLAANCDLCSVSPVSFSFSDGVQTLTQFNSLLPFSTFEFSTNALGQITAWDVDIDAPLGSFIEALFYVDPNNGLQIGDTGQDGYGNAGSNAVAGHFSNEAPMPEPSAMAMMVTFLGAFGFAAVRRRKKIANAG